jgi:putative colanic acid biosynthesis acetyltransferase WcaF
MNSPIYGVSDLPLNGGPSFTLKNKLLRLLWNVVWFFFASWTPSRLHAYRRALLRLFGAQMGVRADVRGSARVWLPSNLVMHDHALIGPDVICYNQDLITIGKRALVSQGAFLCCGSHDVNHPHFPLITKPIVIEENAWVAAYSMVGPGVVIHKGAVLGARAVTFSNLEQASVYIGNPAVKIKDREV